MFLRRNIDFKCQPPKIKVVKAAWDAWNNDKNISIDSLIVNLFQQICPFITSINYFHHSSETEVLIKSIKAFLHVSIEIIIEMHILHTPC